MGYSNEYASKNQFNSLKKYYEKNIKQKLVPLAIKDFNHLKNFKNIKLPYVYEPQSLKKPCVAFDGGIATLFENELYETKILKVSAGFSNEDSAFFENQLFEDHLHIFTGKYKWMNSLDETIEELAEETVDIMIDNPTIKKALNTLGVDISKFKVHFVHKIIKFKGKSIEDNIREVFELSALVNYNEFLKSKTIHNLQSNDCEIKYLIIKDGTLFPSSKTVSELFANAVSMYLSESGHNIIGVVKNSRFVNMEYSWSKIIKSYIHKMNEHTFFKIPTKLEKMIDDNTDRLHYDRYFLSLYNGKVVFETQYAKTLTKDKEKFEKVLDILASQITIQYGGSIITNSYAHENASLSASEALYLTKEIREDFIQNNEGDERNEQ